MENTKNKKKRYAKNKMKKENITTISMSAITKRLLMRLRNHSDEKTNWDTFLISIIKEIAESHNLRVIESVEDQELLNEIFQFKAMRRTYEYRINN